MPASNAHPGPNLMKGTVDLLILKALAHQPRHGYAISEWVQRMTDGALLVEEGTLYPALHRLQDRGWLDAEWGLSENNRRAKFYRLTDRGRTRLEEHTTAWHRYSAAVAKALGAP